jgi:PAS domain S-box-containing protein
MERKKTILLVEDEVIIGLSTSQQLQLEGYEVQHVTSGEKAIALLSGCSDTESPIDLILMDIDLGKGIDGIETAARLLDLCSTPTVFLSSHSEPEFVKRTEQVMAYGYVLKNSPITILDTAIKMALRLHETSTLAKNTFNRALNGVCIHRMIFDPITNKYDCAYISVNPAFTTHTGLSAAEVLSTTIRGLYPNDSADSVIDMYRSALDGRIPHQQEIYFAPTKAWFELNIFPINKTDFAVFIFNVTEKKTLYHRHKMIFENMGPGVVYQDRDGTILSANPSAERVLGLTLDQMQGKTSADPRWKMILPDGEQVSGEQHPAMQAIRTGQKIGPVDRGVYIPELDKYVWLSITASPVYDPNETEHSQVFATFEDITARVEAEKQVSAQKDYLKITLESIGDAVITTDIDGRITYMNPIAEDLCGTALEDVYGESLKEMFTIISSITGEPAINPIDSVLKSKRIVKLSNDTVLISKRGDRHQIADSAAPILTGTGELLGAVLVFRDVSEEYAIRETLKRSVAEKDLLIREVQHRVKNLMNTMASVIEMQIYNLKEESAIESLRDIQTRFKSMATLYDYLYRVKEQEETDMQGYLNALASQVVNIFNTGVIPNVIIETEHVFDVKMLTTIGMILTELITNAMKYAVIDNDNPTLHISLKDDGAGSILKVEDNGPGLPKDYSIKTSTSFGMTLIRALVDQLGGTLDVSNDNGAKITIRF